MRYMLLSQRCEMGGDLFSRTCKVMEIDERLLDEESSLRVGSVGAKPSGRDG